MKEALVAKFSSNARLQSMLLNTFPRRLVEHTTRDRYWGDGGGNGNGLNRLGELLMEVRAELIMTWNTISPQFSQQQPPAEYL